MNTNIKLTGEECEFDETMKDQKRPGTTDAYTVGRIVTKPWGQGGYNNGAMLFDDTSFATEKKYTNLVHYITLSVACKKKIQ